MEEDKATKGNFLLSVAIIFSISLLFVINCEYLIRGDINSVIEWIAGDTVPFLINTAMVFVAIMTIQIFFGNTPLAVGIVGFVYTLISIVSYFKFKTVNAYFQPSDLKLAGEAFSLASKYSLKVTAHIVLGVLFNLWIFMFSFKISNCKFKPHLRLICGTLALVCCFTFFNGFITSETAIANMAPNLTMHKRNNNFQNNGFLFNFAYCTNYLKGPEFPQYTEENFQKLAKAMPKEEHEIKKPNVIMILNEVFFDMTRLEGLKINGGDPLENYHKLAKKYTSGYMAVNVHSNGTAQTEFETISGCSTAFDDASDIAYYNYVNDANYYSNVASLNSLGYKTVSLHPFKREFYSRNEVYDYLGFDEKNFIEEFNEVPLINNYYPDKELFNRAIEEHKKANGTPIYEHILTMQNHPPLLPYYDHGITVENDLEPVAKQKLESYLNLLKETDNAFMDLVNYFDSLDEPTIIVMYGDHAPALAEAANVLTDKEFFGDKTQEEIEIINYTTPFIVWDNFSNEKLDVNYIMPAHITPLIKHLTGDRRDMYYNFLYDNISTSPRFNANFAIDNNGNSIFKLSEEQRRYKKIMWFMEYDRMFGKGYTIPKINGDKK